MSEVGDLRQQIYEGTDKMEEAYVPLTAARERTIALAQQAMSATTVLDELLTTFGKHDQEFDSDIKTGFKTASDKYDEAATILDTALGDVSARNELATTALSNVSAIPPKFESIATYTNTTDEQLDKVIVSLQSALNGVRQVATATTNTAQIAHYTGVHHQRGYEAAREYADGL